MSVTNLNLDSSCGCIPLEEEEEEERGGRLLQTMRNSRGWTIKELCKQIERIEHVSYSVSSIKAWESNSKISLRASKILGSLFDKDHHLFRNCTESPSEVQGSVSKKRSWRHTAYVPSPKIDSDLLHRDAKSAKRTSQLPVDVPSGPVQVRGLRGALLLEEIRIHYGWEPEDLKRQLEQTLGVSYAMRTINGWGNSDRISEPAAKALGSLFKLDSDLFYYRSKSQKTCQSWTPPSFQQHSPLPSSEQEGITERISNAASHHLQEDLPPSQTQESSLVGSPHCEFLKWAELDPSVFSSGDDLLASFDL
jgi:hypothetical protein